MVAEGTEVLGHPAGQDHRELRTPSCGGGDERGQLRERPPLIGAGWVPRSDQDTRDAAFEEERRHRQWIHRLRAPRDRPPAAPRRRRDERGERPLGRRDDRETPRGVARDLEAGQVGGSAMAEVQDGGEPGIGRDGTIAERRDDGVDIGAGRHRQRPDEPPSTSDATDQGGRGRGGARIDGQECSGFARHPCMLPGPAPGRFGGQVLRRPRPPRRPSPRDGR